MSSNPHQGPASFYEACAFTIQRRVRTFYQGAEAEDVFQEVVLRGLERLGSYRGHASLTTWAYALTTNYCINRLRRDHRRRELLCQVGARAHAAPVASANSAEAWIQLQQMWRALPEDLLELGMYYHAEGMNQSQIAELLGVSRRTVIHRLNKLGALARALEEPSYD